MPRIPRTRYRQRAWRAYNAELRKKCRIEEYDTYGNTTDEGSVPGDGKDNDGGGGSTPSGGDSGTTAPDGGDGLE